MLASSNAAIAAGATWAVVSCQQNPKLTEAIVAALQEADDLIKQDPRRAAELYIQATSEKMTPDELVEIMRQPGTLFSPAPHGVMLQAEHLAKVGVLKTKPTNWKDVFHALRARPAGRLIRASALGASRGGLQ